MDGRHALPERAQNPAYRPTRRTPGHLAWGFTIPWRQKCPRSFPPVFHRAESSVSPQVSASQGSHGVFAIYRLAHLVTFHYWSGRLRVGLFSSLHVNQHAILFQLRPTQERLLGVRRGQDGPGRRPMGRTRPAGDAGHRGRAGVDVRPFCGVAPCGPQGVQGRPVAAMAFPAEGKYSSTNISMSLGLTIATPWTPCAYSLLNSSWRVVTVSPAARAL